MRSTSESDAMQNSHLRGEMHNTGGIGIVVAYIEGNLLLATYLS